MAAIRKTWGLLSQRAHSRLVVVQAASMMNSFLDLLGIILLGLAVALGLAYATGSPVPQTIQRGADLFGLSGLSPLMLTALLSVMAAVTLLVKSSLGAYLSLRIARFLSMQQVDASSRLFDKAIRLPLISMKSRNPDQLAFTLTQGMNAAFVGVLGNSLQILTEISLLLVLAIGVFALSPWIAAGTFLYFALIAVLLHKVVSGWARSSGKLIADANVAGMGEVHQVWRGFRLVRAHSLHEFFSQSFAQTRVHAGQANWRLQMISFLPKYTYETALVIGGFLLVFALVWRYPMLQAISLAVAFLAGGSRIIPSMLRLQGAFINLVSSAATAGDVFALQSSVASNVASDLVAQHEAESSSGTRPSAPSVVLSSVSFRYPGENVKALDSVSLLVPGGTSLALVGPSGAGKTTIVDLILGLIESDLGSELIDGICPRAWLDRFPEAAAYVPQETTIFSGTLRANIALTLGRDQGDDARLEQALREVQLFDELIIQGVSLDSELGNSGNSLSGGQIQRIGIARALYREPTLLLLDEPTSALDPISEQAIARLLEGGNRRRTTIVIAHRISTIRRLEQIALVVAGRIRDVGTYNELMDRDQLFREMVTASGLNQRDR